MPPQLSDSPQSSDIKRGEGNFFTNKVGPLPMWAIIGVGIVVLYVLYTKFFSQGNPAVSTTPSTAATSGTPIADLGAALAQILANQQSLSNAGGATSTNPTGTTTDPNASGAVPPAIGNPGGVALSYTPNPNTNTGIQFYNVGYTGPISGFSNGFPYFDPSVGARTMQQIGPFDPYSNNMGYPTGGAQQAPTATPISNSAQTLRQNIPATSK
jgi:hypothetical protein